MRPLLRLLNGIRALFRQGIADEELDAELHEFLQTAVEEKMHTGMSREQANRDARLELGLVSVDSVKDRVRDVGWESVVEGVSRDVAYGVRTLRKSPGFAAVTILTLALGIGANTAIFSLVNAVMLRTLPVAAPEELVFIGYRNPAAADTAVSLLSNPGWLKRIRQETGVFTGVAGYNIRDFKVASDDGVEQVVGQYATGNYHAVVGVPIALGRGFATENDWALGSSPIAVISDSYWQRRFGRSPDALGAQLTVGRHTVSAAGALDRDHIAAVVPCAGRAGLRGLARQLDQYAAGRAPEARRNGCRGGACRPRGVCGAHVHARHRLRAPRPTVRAHGGCCSGSARH